MNAVQNVEWRSFFAKSFSFIKQIHFATKKTYFRHGFA